jgi:uncharacterized protein (TIGR02646 family)
MLQLVSKSLSDETAKALTNLQDKINQKANFKEKVETAQSSWGSKNKTAFEEVKSVLTSMCVSVETCNYCEHNEAADIEHIYPKSFFPEFTFAWDNYLLACKQCNSGYKLDKCYVLDENGNPHSTQRGVEPIHKTVALINPRLENPNKFMILSLTSFKFEILSDLTIGNNNKALKTLEILELNERTELIKARKNVADYFYLRMITLIRILKSNTIQEIENTLLPHEDLIDANDLSKPIEVLKENYKNALQKHILSHAHPSVWYSIKTVESQTNFKWKAIFQTIPEALNW